MKPIQPWQATIRDENGTVINGPTVTFYNEADDTQVENIYDENGADVDNPFTGTTEGFVQVYLPAGQYYAEGTDGIVSSEDWNFEIPAPKYDDVSDLISETLPVGNEGTIVDAGGFRFEVASPTATDHHITTAGGDKLYVKPGSDGYNVAAFGAALDGVTDDTIPARTALGAASADGISRVIIPNGTLYAPNLLHNEYKDVRFFGPGEVTGAYRRYSVNESQNPSPSVPAFNMAQLVATNAAPTPTVVLVGDSISTYSANTRVSSGMLTWAVENQFRNEFDGLNYYNRAIGGQQYTHLDGISNDTSPDWYTNPAVPWLDYIEALAPDCVVLSFGMNDSSGFSSTAFLSVIAKINAFAKVPDIVICTNLNPSLDGSPAFPGSEDKSQQEGHDYCAGYLRTYALKNKIPLWDFHRLHCMVRDGFDPFYGQIGDRDTNLTIESVAGTQEGYLGERNCYNWAATIDIDENSFIGAEHIDFHYGGDGWDNSYLRVRNNAGNYRFIVTSGTNNITQDFIDTSVSVGTDVARTFSFEVYGNQITFYEGAGTDRPNTAPIMTTKVVRSGGEVIPRVSTNAGAGILQTGIMYYDKATQYTPTATDTELWGATDSGFDTYGGSGFNHPGSAMFTKVYWPIVSKSKLSGNQSPPALSDPSVGDVVGMNSIVRINKASGGVDTYRAMKSFVWVELLGHVFDADPDIILIGSNSPRTGIAPTPSGHTAPVDFDIYMAGNGRFVTTVDRKEDYRDRYQPAFDTAYYVDNVNGSDANDGLTRTTAKATFGAARNLLNANTNGVIYLIHAGKAYDESDGLTHVSTVGVSYSLIGIPDADGNGPYAANAERASDFSFSANGTYSWVYQSATPSDNLGRISDITVLDAVILDWATGRSIRVPREYEAKTSLAEVAACPGSYWNDTAANILYVNRIGGGLPVVSENIVIPRSNIGIVLGVVNTQIYVEGITFLGDAAGPGLANVYYNECVNCYSRVNGFYTEDADDFGTRHCTAIEPAADGFNYHNIGKTVSGVTLTNPVVVTVNGHQRNNGDEVLFDGILGTVELNGNTYTLQNVTANTAELQGVDGTAFTPYISGGKLRQPSPTFHALRPTAWFSGNTDSSHQSSSAHENCEGCTVEPLFVGPYRDHITDINTSKHTVYGGFMGTTRIPASAGSNNRVAQATDTADLALMGVEWGGYYDPSITLFEAASTATLRVMDVELPYDSTQWNEVTSDW